ncbi:MAG: indolepyruvate oxidoreductase subunit beta [Rikenellaceae bacterium]|nr:indolepyruvate oxidoreductase subunit beta [Rikenellaceae bacterium]
MRKDIILSGVGGQGILSIAIILAEAAMHEGFNVKQAEVHGMSVRGSEVHSNLRISSLPIFSDLISKGTADLILSLEPLEMLRYLPYISKEGWVVANSAPIKDLIHYPDIEEVLEDLAALPHIILVDADRIAGEQGLILASNMVILGAAATLLELEDETLRQAIRNHFENKGEDIVEMNLEAYRLGREVIVNQSAL